MRFAEEILLMLLDEKTGYFIPIPEWKMSCVLAGGVLMDLALENRIDTDVGALTLIDSTPTGDDLLDPTLEEIAKETETHPPQFWVERIARNADAINTMALGRLSEIGILDADEGGFWNLSSKIVRSGRYPLVDGRTGEEIKSRIMRTLLDDEIPDPRDIAIIGLMHSCGGIRAMMEPEEYEEAEERVELLSKMDLIGQNIGIAVQSSYRPPESMRTVRHRAMPVIGLKDMLLSKTFRARDLPRFFAEQAQKHGPVFRLKAGGRDMVILASAEQNHWFSQKGRLHVRSQDFIADFQHTWGTGRSIASMDGADHFRMRKMVRAGNSRAVVEDRLGEVLTMARGHFDLWGIGKGVRGEMACQRMIGEQVANLSVSIAPADTLDDLLKYEYRALLVTVYKILPHFMLRTPAMKRALERVLELYAQIHASHTPAQRAGKRRDLADDLMDLHYSDPQFLPETDLGFAFIAPIIAGHYLGSEMSFAIYEMLANPDVQKRIAAEADALFADGDPTGEDVDLSAIDVTHRFIMETLRLHPVIPMHLRTVTNGFEVEGYKVPPNSILMIAFTAPHFDEKFFKNPLTFDIDRFAPPRSEHKQYPGAYAPFGIGTHTCGGARWSELQLAMNLMLMAHHLELEMDPKRYKLGLNPLPKMSPDKRFGFRVVRHRHPFKARKTAYHPKSH